MKYLYNYLFKYQTDILFIQFFRYFFVGCLAFLVDIFLLYCLTEYFNVYYLLSAGISFTTGLITNYLLSILWVFKNRKFDIKVEFIIFTIIGIVGLIFNELLIFVLTEFFLLFYLLSKILTTFIVFLWNFLARRFILYSKKYE